MPRSDNLKADLRRVKGMSASEFEAEWGRWAEATDRDPERVRARWVRDLEKAIPFAEREEEALDELVKAKEAHRKKSTDETKARRDAAVEAVQAIRAEERANRAGITIGGDAYTGVK